MTSARLLTASNRLLWYTRLCGAVPPTDVLI
jgi:hypothetical protein